MKAVIYCMFVTAPPRMKCERSVITPVYKSDVRLVCHIKSTSPLSDVYIAWDGQERLRPTARQGWPPGVEFDRDDEYLAYLRQVKLMVLCRLYTMLPDTSCIHLLPSTCILHRLQNCCQFVCHPSVAGYKGIKVDRDINE